MKLNEPVDSERRQHDPAHWTPEPPRPQFAGLERVERDERLQHPGDRDQVQNELQDAVRPLPPFVLKPILKLRQPVEFRLHFAIVGVQLQRLSESGEAQLGSSDRTTRAYAVGAPPTAGPCAGCETGQMKYGKPSARTHYLLSTLSVYVGLTRVFTVTVPAPSAAGSTDSRNVARCRSRA